MIPLILLAIRTVFICEQPPAPTWDLISKLADERQEAGDLTTAESLRREALESAEAALDPHDNQLVLPMLKLATLLNVEGRTKQAEPLARKAYSIAWDAGDEDKAGVALNEIGVGLLRDREYARAEPVLRRSVALLEKAEGEDSMNAARTENNLATLYSNQHEYDKAKKEMKRALPIYEKHLGPNNPGVVQPLTNLCAILLQNHQGNECEPYLRRGMAIAQEAFPQSVQMAALQEELATLETVRGNYREAANLFEKVIAMEERLLGPDHPLLAQALTNYAYALRRGHQGRAAKLAKNRADSIRKTLPNTFTLR